MDYEIQQKIQPELSSDENLLWSGRPRQGLVLRGFDVFLIPFSLVWCGFAVFWEFCAYTSDAPLFFLLFGGIFIVIGLYFVFGRFIIDAMKRKGTYYGVTNERIIILSEFPTRKIKSLNLRTLSDITFSNRPDGSGSITFGPQHPMSSWMGGMDWFGMGHYRSPMFESIKDAKAVYEIIRNAQKKLHDFT